MCVFLNWISIFHIVKWILLLWQILVLTLDCTYRSIQMTWKSFKIHFLNLLDHVDVCKNEGHKTHTKDIETLTNRINSKRKKLDTFWLMFWHWKSVLHSNVIIVKRGILVTLLTHADRIRLYTITTIIAINNVYLDLITKINRKTNKTWLRSWSYYTDRGLINLHVVLNYVWFLLSHECYSNELFIWLQSNNILWRARSTLPW